MSTRPGIHHQFDFDRYSATDRVVIDRFSRYFYITRSLLPIQIGNSEYRAFLMRPAADLSFVLNVDREIVVLLAPYETFEIRTLKAYDEVFRQFEADDASRIDKSMRFIVSKDRDIQQKIRHYLQQEPEYPVVVTYLYNDFCEHTDDFIHRRIRENYIIRDLFGYQSPLRHEYYFFGRDKIVNHVVDLHKSGQNAGIFGLRKSGKTSTIYAIQRRARTAGFRAVQLDCQSPGVHARRWSALIVHIVSEIRTVLSLRALPSPNLQDEAAVSDWFRVMMQRTMADARTNILLIFDEIENISPKTAASRHWKYDRDSLLFWQTLRSFFQHNEKWKLTFCFVGTNPSLFEQPKIGDVDNPVYLFAPKTFIAPFRLEDAKEMCQRLGYFMGLNFEDDIIARLHERFGGHPFFIRQFCSRIHQIAPFERPVNVSRRLFDAAENDGGAAIKSYMSEIIENLKNFYPEEYDMLVYLAEEKYDVFEEISKTYPATIEHLVGYGIIRMRASDAEFSMGVLKDMIVESSRVGMTENVEARRQEISRRRNALEESVRIRLFFWAQTLPSEVWDAAVKRCISKPEEARFKSLEYRFIFSKNESPLYIVEMMKFVEYADFFAIRPGFQSEINRAFDVVNKIRPDAHAKSITEESFADWNSAMSFLEDQFIVN